MSLCVLILIKASKQDLLEDSELSEKDFALLQLLNLIRANVLAVDYSSNIEARKNLFAIFDDSRELVRLHAVVNYPKHAS